jgi:HEPN domain-containing protein
MPQLQVSIQLPYLLRLKDGDYPTSPAGEPLALSQMRLSEGAAARTNVRALFDHPDVSSTSARQRLRMHDAEQLLRRTNRLLRWYRAVSRSAEVIELTRAQASPFRFEVAGAAADDDWGDLLTYKAELQTPISTVVEELTEAVHDGLSTGDEPGVADLFLLDAEQALYDGRFREAVLLSWSTIDAVFNAKYDRLVNAALAGEWAPAREFFTGVDFGLRNKMSAVMHLVAKRSLFREPDDLWEAISASYNKRNSIIHRGENASEDEAQAALQVARRIIEVMDSLRGPNKTGTGSEPNGANRSKTA